MKGTVLVTGGIGFIGSHLIDVFSDEGFFVRVMDIPERPVWLAPEIEYAQGSVTEKKKWETALSGIDFVVHLAVYPDYHLDFSTYFSVNAAGTALMYEVIAEKKIPVKQIVIASSQSAYGEGKYQCPEHGVFFARARSPEDLRAGIWNVRCPRGGHFAEVLPSEEEDPLHPISPYGASKMAADEIALTLGRQYGIPSTALRFAMVSGAHPSLHRPYAGAVRFFAEQAALGREIPMHEDGNQLRDFINVKDIGRAHTAVLGNPAAYFQAFNAGSGAPHRLSELAEEVCRALDVPCRPVFKNEFRPFTPRHWVMSSAKLSALGWAAQCSFSDSVSEFVHQYKKISYG